MEGIPLAIELAAATLRRLPVAALAASLRSEAGWVEAIQATARDLPPRQRTLAGAIAWSYDLLDPDSRSCLRRLAVFAGSFTPDAAAAVCAEPGDPAAWKLRAPWRAQRHGQFTGARRADGRRRRRWRAARPG